MKNSPSPRSHYSASRIQNTTSPKNRRGSLDRYDATNELLAHNREQKIIQISKTKSPSHHHRRSGSTQIGKPLHYQQKQPIHLPSSSTNSANSITSLKTRRDQENAARAKARLKLISANNSPLSKRSKGKTNNQFEPNPFGTNETRFAWSERQMPGKETKNIDPTLYRTELSSFDIYACARAGEAPLRPGRQSRQGRQGVTNPTEAILRQKKVQVARRVTEAALKRASEETHAVSAGCLYSRLI